MREATVEELLRHARWVQAVARRLIREDAEDLAQDVWVRATQRPPRFGSPRAWLAQVLRNRARNQARDDHRRRRREEATGELLDSPPTPQELTERMELHHLLAQLVAELPDEYRQVVHLRYVEDRAPTDIARLLQQPPGTIRWRLHEAMAQLRARLDDRAGGRRAWILAIAPLAGLPPEVVEAAAASVGGARPPASRPPAATAPTLARRRIPLAGFGVAAVGAIALLLVAAIWRLRDPGGGTEASAPGAASVDRHRGGSPPGPGVPRLAAQAGAAVAEPDCPEVEPMRQFVATFKQAADPWRNPTDVFAEGAPNPALEAALQPMVEGFLQKLPAGCDLSLSCRGLVCELAVMSPDSSERWACHPRPGPEFQDRLAGGIDNLVDSGTPYHDPIKGKSFTRMEQLWRFYREDGAAVAQDRRPAEPELKYDFSRRPPAPPPALSETCRLRWARLEREHDERRRFVGDRLPESVFATSPPNPELLERVMARIRQALGRPSTPLPMAIECRGPVCRLAPSPAQDPLAIEWRCREATAGLPAVCFPAPGGWFDILKDELRDQVGKLWSPRRGSGQGQGHARVPRGQDRREAAQPLADHPGVPRRLRLAGGSPVL